MRAAVVAIALAAALAACQPPPTDEESESPGDGEVTTLTPSEEPTTSASDEPSQSGTLDPAAQAAVDDLAERLDVDASAITAGPLEEVTWPDGSIGCPKPGKHYTQMLQPGTRLILTVDGAQYAYHGKGEEPLFYCDSPTAPTSADSM
jgi:hypothetical protein